MNHFTRMQEAFMEALNDLSDKEIRAIQDFLEKQPDCQYRFTTPFFATNMANGRKLVCNGISMDTDSCKVYVMQQYSQGQLVRTSYDLTDLDYISINDVVNHLGLELPD